MALQGIELSFGSLSLFKCYNPGGDWNPGRGFTLSLSLSMYKRMRELQANNLGEVLWHGKNLS